MSDVNCDGLSGAGGWTAPGGGQEQITSAANNPGGGGGKGQRHWMGDGVNQVSGSMKLPLPSPQTELRIRWYMRHEAGFAWQSLTNNKIVYIDPVGTGATKTIMEYSGMGKVQVWSYGGGGGCGNQVGCASADGTGWQAIMGGSVSDGMWHVWEVHLKMDTNGADGIVELWIDNNKLIDVTNADLGTTTFNEIQFGSNGFTPQNGKDMYIDFDDIAVTNDPNNRIGSLLDSLAPSNPTVLIAN
ncbi:MAG: hypothetical protein ACE5D6_02135 [Candidatus Zixiibacteriota bacterium]